MYPRMKILAIHSGSGCGGFKVFLQPSYSVRLWLSIPHPREFWTPHGLSGRQGAQAVPTEIFVGEKHGTNDSESQSPVTPRCARIILFSAFLPQSYCRVGGCTVAGASEFLGENGIWGIRVGETGIHRRVFWRKEDRHLCSFVWAEATARIWISELGRYVSALVCGLPYFAFQYFRISCFVSRLYVCTYRSSICFFVSTFSLPNCVPTGPHSHGLTVRKIQMPNDR